MASSVTSSKVIQTYTCTTQKVAVSLDDGTAVSQSMEFDHAPDEYWVVHNTFGTDVIQIFVSFDTANGEVDIEADIGGSGSTYGTHTATVFLKWYARAEQDASSISVS